MPIDDYLSNPRLARYPFIFIVTYGRSGSTLLQGLLNKIPGYCIRGENSSALFRIYNACTHVKTARYKFGRERLQPIHPWYGADRIDFDGFTSGCADLFLDKCLRPPGGTRSCGFKEVRYTLAEIPDDAFAPYLDFIRDAFPGAGIVFNIRDVEQTLKSGWWAKMEPSVARERVTGAIARMEKYAGINSSSFVFSYDMMISDPGSCVQLFDFLGEPFDVSLVETTLATRHGY